MTTKDKPTFWCHSRRHMHGPAYKTYDAMLAMALTEERTPTGELVPYRDQRGQVIKKTERKPGDPPLVFFGAVRPTLVNYTNTSETQLYEHIDQLLDSGWLIDESPDKPQPRRDRGRQAPRRYVILEHDVDYVPNKGSSTCPPFKYAQHDDSENGIERGELMGEKNDQPVDFTIRNLERTSTGRFAIATLRLAGKLPGKDWNEMMANLREHPERLADAVRIERGLRESGVKIERASEPVRK